MAVSADLDESLRLTEFKAQFPQQFVQVGVAEQNLLGVSAGLALGGQIPFATSFAVFNPGRNWDQLRVAVCFSNLNVKVVGGHAGLSVGEDGATAQAMEDVALTRVLPRMTVVVPADADQAYQATLALAAHTGPAYLRLSRWSVPNLTAGVPFELGKAQILRRGTDLTIIATGIMVEQALLAAQQLSIRNLQVQVINLHTIKPIDVAAITQAANQNGVIVTAEEHQRSGGLGSAVAEVVTQATGKTIFQPTVIEMVAMPDSFGESGRGEELLQKYQLTAKAIVGAAERGLQRRSQLR
jgi:transketolase